MEKPNTRKTLENSDVQGGAVVGLNQVCGICAGTQVLTLDGALAIEFLTPGDRVVTRSGVRALHSIEFRQIKTTPYRLVSSALGKGRPEEDMLLPPGQKILIRDWQAKALVNQPSELVQVCDLVDGRFIKEGNASILRLFSLKFSNDEICYAGGLELLCPAREPSIV